MPHADTTDVDVAALVQRSDEAAAAFIRGDMREYAELVRHADDCTLLAPFGGPVRRGFDDSDEALAALAAYFTAGEARVELLEAYASGDLVVLVVIERQHGEVGGLPDRDWSLRVTLVFRRDGDEWYQVHRHADALVEEITLEQLAALTERR